MRDVLATNNVGLAASFHPFVARCAQRGSGTLVGIASVAAIRGLPGHGAYCASKAGVVAYCESLRVELPRQRRARGDAAAGLRGHAADGAQPAIRMPFLMAPERLCRPRLPRHPGRRSYRVIPWQMAVVAKAAAAAAQRAVRPPVRAARPAASRGAAEDHQAKGTPVGLGAGAAMIDVVVFFFLLGVFARLVKSDLRLPEALYETLSIYLLLAIGLKGGIELSKQPLAAGAAGAGLHGAGLRDPVRAVPGCCARCAWRGRCRGAGGALRLGQRGHLRRGHGGAGARGHRPREPRRAVGGGDGGAGPGGRHPAGALGLRRAAAGRPACPVAARAARAGATLAHDVLFGKSVLLLLGGLAHRRGGRRGRHGADQGRLHRPLQGRAGAVPAGTGPGGRRPAGRGAALRLPRCWPWAGRAAAAGAGGRGWSAGAGAVTGGVALLATLAASASYIAAPTAMRIAVPQANAALSITAALGITFPFNIVVGIPLYIALAQRIPHDAAQSTPRRCWSSSPRRAREGPGARRARARAQGWTVSEVHGAGREGVREGAWEADRTIELKMICDAAVADAIAEHVLATYAPHYSVAMYFSAVQVLRPERY
jgi:uncharacterized protein